MKKGKTTSWDGQRQVDAYILDSGRVITPNRGLLSVGGDESTDVDHPFVLYEGYDSVFEHWGLSRRGGGLGRRGYAARPRVESADAR